MHSQIAIHPCVDRDDCAILMDGMYFVSEKCWQRIYDCQDQKELQDVLRNIDVVEYSAKVRQPEKVDEW